MYHRRMVEGVGSFRLLDEIDRDLTLEWRAKRRATSRVIEHFGGPHGPRRVMPAPCARTVNREMDPLQILAAAVPKYLKQSPIRGLPDLDVISPKRRIPTERDEARLLPYLASDDRGIMLCGLDSAGWSKRGASSINRSSLTIGNDCKPDILPSRSRR
jgi:hypothetical protein